jgi:hypothetical protein
MPRKRRITRTVRRPNFQPAPEQGSAPEDEAPPTFADEAVAAVPAYGATGPVETRPHWIGRDDRVQGRRLAQLRRSSGEARGTGRAVATGQLPTFSRAFVHDEIRRILVTSGALVAVLIVLTIALR